MIERYIVCIIKTFYEPYFQNNMWLVWNVIIPARLSICPCRKFDSRMTLCWAIRLLRFIYLSTFISLCGVTAVGHLWCCACSRFGKIYWSEIWMFLVTNQQVIYRSASSTTYLNLMFCTKIFPGQTALGIEINKLNTLLNLNIFSL